MSWLNISGNLSSLANNVSSFTKEVLTEASKEDNSLDKDNGNEAIGDFNPALRDELLFLRSEVNSKDEQVLYLQDEIEKLRTDFQNHTTNLKQHLIRKDEEIDVYAEKMNQSELELQEKIGRLTKEKFRLEKELGDKTSKDETDNDSDWENDWGGGNNDLEVSNLRDENESLSNEVSMKEIVLSSIESKMRQMSGGKHIDASDFTTWIEDYLNDMQQEKEKASNLTELVIYLKEEMNDNTEGDNIDLDQVYDWVNSTKKEKIVLKRKIKKLENTISSVEESVKSYEKDLKNFQIADFSDWIKSLKGSPRPEQPTTVMNSLQSEDDGSKALLMSIQAMVRDFDDEDANFEVKDFNAWIDKVQNRLDDLEVELLNEQEIKESEERQRVEERMKLKEMFDEKEKQISMLKVELYHKSSVNVHEDKIEGDAHNESHSTLNEQYTEALARSEALQDELTASKKQSSEAINSKTQELNELSESINNKTEELNKLTKTNSEMNVKLQNAFNEKEDFNQKFIDAEQTIVELRKDIEALNNGNNSTFENLTEENEVLKGTIYNLQQESLHSGSTIENMAKENEVLKDTIGNLQQESVNTGSTIDSMAKENEILKGTIHNLQQDNMNSGDLSMQLQDVKLQVENVNTNNTMFSEKNRLLEMEMSNVCEDIENMKIVVQAVITLEGASEQTWQSRSDKTSSLMQSLKDTFEHSLLSHQEHTRTKEELMEVQSQLEVQGTYVSSAQALLHLVITGLSENIFPGKNIPPELFTQPPSMESEFYLRYLKSCADHMEETRAEMEKLREEKDKVMMEKMTENADLQQKINELQQHIQSLEIENASLTTTTTEDDQPTCDHERTIQSLSGDLMRANAELQSRATELERLQNEQSLLNTELINKSSDLDTLHKDTEEMTATITNLENELKEKEVTLQQEKEKKSKEDVDATGGGGVKFGVLKRKIKELEETNTNLQRQIEELSQQPQLASSPVPDLPQSNQNLESTPDNASLREEILNLADQLNDLQTYNAAYQREVEQLKQQLAEAANTANTTNQQESQNDVEALNKQLQQYQTYCSNLQSENEHLKRLNQAALVQGSEQEVAIRMELQNQINILTNENQHYQTEYENLRQGWIKYQEESNAYTESLQHQYQQLQSEYQQLQSEYQQLQERQTQEHEVPSHSQSNILDSSGGSSNQLQEKMHNLSLMLTEKAEECVRLQQENDTIKAKLVEIQNDTSDMELIREECKQLKAMLMSKDHEETISNLQNENKQLKRDLDQIQKLGVEKDNDLSDMDLLRDECKQLKQMLVNKDSPAEFQQLHQKKSELEQSLIEKDEELLQKNASMIDMENAVSDMELVREECKQLKLMLMNKDSFQQHPQTSDQNHQLYEAQLNAKDEQIRQKDSLIHELQNTSTDVELLREQCEHLKTMLSEKDGNITAGSGLFNDSVFQKSEAYENSFMIQVQQLEEMMKEKDEVIAAKDQEIQRQMSVITELQNSTSDMELLHNECRALKAMISEKEQMFTELQNDLDLANDMVEQKNTDMSVKVTENKLLRDEMNELNDALVAKETELGGMREEMQEAILQDENIHLLQTEYRNVEEQLQLKERELSESQQQLFELETRYEKVKVYEEQFQDLKNTLKEKEESLNSLQLQSSNSSILESETVSLLHQELNQLKSLLYEREQETSELRKTLETKNLELHDLQGKLNQVSEDLLGKQNKIKELEQQIENIKLERQGHQMQAENSNTAFSETHSQLVFYKSSATELTNQNEELNKQLWSRDSKLDELLQELETLKTDKNRLEDEHKQLNYTLQNQTIHVEQLERTVRQSEQSNKELLETLNTKGHESANSVEELKEQQILKILVSNLKTLLQISEHTEDVNLANDLSEIVQKVQTLLNMIQQRDTMLDRLQVDHQTQMNKLQNDLEEMKSQYDFKLTDLQSQLTEYKELESMYGAKCLECENLQRSLSQMSQQLQLQHQQETKTSSEESDRLRDELAKNSHSFLDKNKECDQLKLTVLKLEEKIFNQEQALSQAANTDQLSHQIQELSSICQAKDQEVQELKSKLEDNDAVLESGKKEKAFLDQLIKEKQTLATDREELLFQRNQLSSRVQELEIDNRHKDTNSKEIEVKTKRELERLRNHLMMIEENNTKDIMECQDREDALRNELEETKATLGKKSTILQDSSIQFQEHVGTLEEQLHVIAAQRDANTLNLEKCREKIESDAAAIFNLQSALEQLQREKDEQYEYMLSHDKRKEEEYEKRIDDLMQDQEQAKSAMTEASLAVKGITKLQFELEQKDRELKISNDQVTELASTLKEREMQYTKILQASDGKMDKSLIKNLLLKYFQAPEDKRSDILQVVGGLLDMSPQQIKEIGSGAVPSKVGGWISNVWGYAATPKKTAHPPPPSPAPAKLDSNQSFSEMFIKFLEHESTQKTMVDSSASLANAANTTVPSNMLMLSSNPPDILPFHHKPADLNNSSSSTIPAPGQEIPRVHTHHAQSTLKNLLS